MRSTMMIYYGLNFSIFQLGILDFSRNIYIFKINYDI